MAKRSTPAKPFDSGDQLQVQTRAARLKDRQDQDDEDFKAMMAIPNFRAFVWRLLSRAHVFQTSADVSNPYNTFFREGERNGGLQLMADVMRLCPQHYQTMAAESAKRDKELNDG